MEKTLDYCSLDNGDSYTSLGTDSDEVTIVGRAFHADDLIKPLGQGHIFKAECLRGKTRASKCMLTVTMRCEAKVQIGINPDEWKMQKVLLRKLWASKDFEKIWTQKNTLSEEFVKALLDLPPIYDKDLLDNFKRFFRLFGHGFVKEGYYGGEVLIKLSPDQNKQWSEQLKHNPDSDPFHIVEFSKSYFRGGDPNLQDMANLESWKDSIHECPVEIVLDQDDDVEFYHEFVAKLTWLPNKIARAEAIEMAIEDLKNETNNKPETGESLDLDLSLSQPILKASPIDPSENDSANKLQVISDDHTVSGRLEGQEREVGSMQTSPVPTSQNLLSLVTLLIGTTLNARTGKLMESSILSKKPQDTDVTKVNLQNEILLEFFTHNEPKNGKQTGTIALGTDSFVLKFIVRQHTLAKNFFAQLCRSESMFCSGYVAHIKKLPRKHNPKSLKTVQKTQNFFDTFGHGVVLSHCEGGEVIFKLNNGNDSIGQECTQYVMASKVKEVLYSLGHQLTETQLDVQYAIQFRGGSTDLQNLETFQEWRQSLAHAPVPIRRVEEDVLLHQDLLKNIKWVSHAKERAVALHEAFKDHNFNRKTIYLDVE